MILEKVHTPEDLKNLSIGDLKLLSQEIRQLIVEVISKKGGHLASSLGAVEICVALHYLLDTPNDTIIFDVGHQVYPHKILTGRKNSFHTIREYKGVSGFPNFKESIYDTYTSGHASTAVSWAQGIAEGKKLAGDKSKTAALIGDGSLTGGMCFEALNNCGHAQSDVLVIFNHNEMSISPSVGALSSYLTKIISAPIYNRIREELESFLAQSSLGKKVSNRARKFEESLKGLVIPGIFFEELGFRYFGPIDGNSLPALIPNLKNVISLKGPRLLHIVTKKGKGYKFSEDNPEDFHSSSIFHIDEGIFKEGKESFSETFSRKLIALAKDNPKLVAITAAMPKGTGLNLFGEAYPQRCFDVGIAEAHAVGFASGLAKQGFKPVVAIYSTFLQRAFDQIIHDVALQELGVIFVLDRAGVVGEDGPTHHGVFDIGYLRMIPNMVCMAPKDKEEFEDMLELAAELNSPVSIRFPKGEAYSLGFKSKVALGKAQVIRQGGEFCIVAVGAMVKNALECLDILDKEGIKGSLVNARFIKPLHEELLVSLAREYDFVLTLEEGNINCGFGSACLELWQKHGCLGQAIFDVAGFGDEFIAQASREQLLEMYGLDGQSLALRVKGWIKR